MTKCIFSRCEPRDILSEISSNCSQQRSASSLSNEAYQQVINLLQLVKSSCSRSPIASAMFMEELASAIHDGIVHSKVEVSMLTANLLVILIVKLVASVTIHSQSSLPGRKTLSQLQ